MAWERNRKIEDGVMRAKIKIEWFELITNRVNNLLICTCLTWEREYGMGSPKSSSSRPSPWRSYSPVDERERSERGEREAVERMCQ